MKISLLKNKRGESKENMEKKTIIANVFIGIAIAALLGGFLLGLFNKSADKNESMENEENSSETFEYEGSSPVEETDDMEESEEGLEDENELTPQEKEALRTAKQKAKEIKKHLKEEDEHETGENFLESYKKKYNKSVVDKTVKLTHDVVFLLANNKTKPSDWKDFSTPKMLKKVSQMNKEAAYLSFQILDIELVPIEKEFDGIVIGVLLRTNKGMSLLEFDFIVKNNQPYLDDINLSWSY